MRLNFKRIAALASSALMLGLTAGIASAASYPAPFVSSSGTANVAIVYGSGAALSDSTAAGSIATSLSSFVSGAGNVTVSGGIPLDRGTASRIWLNTSLTNAQSIYTATDLPTVLATSTFSGSVSATVTPQITLISGATAGGINSGTITFAKQPTASYDPNVGVALGTTASQPLYNATVTFGTAENFTATNSQGPILNLFGRQYVVSSGSTSGSSGKLILFQSAQTLTLAQGGTTGSSTGTATINGVSHTIQLVNAGSSSAIISVDGTSQSVNVGSSVTINGVSVAVTSVQSSTAGGNTATILVGANQLTFQNGQSVLQGTNNNVILGTTAYFSGTPDALNSLTVAVYAPDSTHAWIAKGGAFTDPVFGSFSVTNGGLSSDIGDPARDVLKITTAGATTLDLTFTNKMGNANTFDWATNKTQNWNLSDANGYPIYPYEAANLSLQSYTLTGTGSSNQVVGHLLQFSAIYINNGSTYTNDYVQFTDRISGAVYKTGTPTASGTAPLILDGRQYTVSYVGANGSSSASTAQIKFPTSDSANAGTFVLFPTILANNGESIMLTQPLNLSLASFGTSGSAVSAFNLPNGNGYTSTGTISFTGNSNFSSWTIGTSGAINTSAPFGSNSTTITAGRLTYNFSSTGVANRTMVYVNYPTTAGQVGSSGVSINEPALVVWEGKDTGNNYNAVIVDTTQNPIGTSTNGVGVNGVYYTSASGYGNSTSGVTLYSNSNLAQWMDYFGTLVTKDSTNSGQPIATLTYPVSQAYEQLYLGGSNATVTSGNLGNVLVTDSQVSTVSSKNLVVIGGSCINSAAAALVGGAYCGSAWTAATNIGSGQFLIKGYTSGIPGNSFALLVAGYEAADTTNAANYLTHYTVDTSKAYSGTSGTTANLIVS